jgi:hypothetical protein
VSEEGLPKKHTQPTRSTPQSHSNQAEDEVRRCQTLLLQTDPTNNEVMFVFQEHMVNIGRTFWWSW